MKNFKDNSDERRQFINNSFHSPLRESLLLISHFVEFAEYLINVMPIVINDFYTMINLNPINCILY